MDSGREKKAWREVSHGQRFLNAFRGIYVLSITTRHFFWVHLPATVAVLILGFYFHVSSLEWIALLFSIGLVIVTEALNTAIEIDIDLTSPEYHPYARDTKDVAAAAVLISAIISAIVGFIIFLPKIL